MGWMVLFTLLLCMAASALSVYPGDRANRASRKVSAAAVCAMMGTGIWMLVGRAGALSDLLALSPDLFWRAALAVGVCAALGILLSALINRICNRRT